MRVLLFILSLVFCWSFALAAGAQSGKPSSPASETSADKPVVTIDGEVIRESDVNQRFQEVVGQVLGPNPQPEQVRQAQQIYRPQVVESMVDEWVQAHLVPKDAKKEQIAVTDADMDKELEKEIQSVLERQNWTREQLDQVIRQQQGISLDELLEKSKNNPDFKNGLLLDKVVEHKYADKLKIEPESVKAYYQGNLREQFTEAEQVRASHILIKTADRDPATGQLTPRSQAQQAQAREKIEQVAEEVKKTGSDFAALARAHSEDPSAPQGGDLNFFTREAMVPEFAETAFALKPGQTSDVVKTQFGYHVIKVTDRKPARTVPFDEVKGQIDESLTSRKKQEAIQVYFEELKKQVDITYHDKPRSNEAPVTIPPR